MTAMTENVKKRSGASINVYLFLKKEQMVLLSLRDNTGYFDGYYGLVSGHVEDGESASSAMIREAKEEANLVLHRNFLQPVHVMHRKTNRFNMDVFFECTAWDGMMENLEPTKCRELKFFSLLELPKNVVPYIDQALQNILQKKAYSEEGWIS